MKTLNQSFHPNAMADTSRTTRTARRSLPANYQQTTRAQSSNTAHSISASTSTSISTSPLMKGSNSASIDSCSSLDLSSIPRSSASSTSSLIKRTSLPNRSRRSTGSLSTTSSATSSRHNLSGVGAGNLRRLLEEKERELGIKTGRQNIRCSESGADECDEAESTSSTLTPHPPSYRRSHSSTQSRASSPRLNDSHLIDTSHIDFDDLHDIDRELEAEFGPALAQDWTRGSYIRSAPASQQVSRRQSLAELITPSAITDHGSSPNSNIATSSTTSSSFGHFRTNFIRPKCTSHPTKSDDIASSSISSSSSSSSSFSSSSLSFSSSSSSSSLLSHVPMMSLKDVMGGRFVPIIGRAKSVKTQTIEPTNDTAHNTSNSSSSSLSSSTLTSGSRPSSRPKTASVTARLYHQGTESSIAKVQSTHPPTMRRPTTSKPASAVTLKPSPPTAASSSSSTNAILRSLKCSDEECSDADDDRRLIEAAVALDTAEHRAGEQMATDMSSHSRHHRQERLFRHRRRRNSLPNQVMHMPTSSTLMANTTVHTSVSASNSRATSPTRVRATNSQSDHLQPKAQLCPMPPPPPAALRPISSTSKHLLSPLAEKQPRSKRDSQQDDDNESTDEDHGDDTNMSQSPSIPSPNTNRPSSARHRRRSHRSHSHEDSATSPRNGARSRSSHHLVPNGKSSTLSSDNTSSSSSTSFSGSLLANKHSNILAASDVSSSVGCSNELASPAEETRRLESLIKLWNKLRHTGDSKANEIIARTKELSRLVEDESNDSNEMRKARITLEEKEAEWTELVKQQEEIEVENDALTKEVREMEANKYKGEKKLKDDRELSTQLDTKIDIHRRRLYDVRDEHSRLVTELSELQSATRYMAETWDRQIMQQRLHVQASEFVRRTQQHQQQLLSPQAVSPNHAARDTNQMMDDFRAMSPDDRLQSLWEARMTLIATTTGVGDFIQLVNAIESQPSSFARVESERHEKQTRLDQLKMEQRSLAMLLGMNRMARKNQPVSNMSTSTSTLPSVIPPADILPLVQSAHTKLSSIAAKLNSASSTFSHSPSTTTLFDSDTATQLITRLEQIAANVLTKEATHNRRIRRIE